MEARGVGSCLVGKSTICSTAGGILGVTKRRKWRSGSATECVVIVEIECNGECWEGRV